MRKVALLLGVAALSLGFAPAPLPRPLRRDARDADLEAIQGQWVRVWCFARGHEVVDPSATMTITGRRMVCVPTGEPRGEWSIHLDATKKPKVFDRRGTGGDKREIPRYGIYSLERGVLTICSRATSNALDRPIDYNGQKPWLCVEVFKRKK
jgi:uncharacterized protein (TIGR03067 family)